MPPQPHGGPPSSTPCPAYAPALHAYPAAQNTSKISQTRPATTARLSPLTSGMGRRHAPAPAPTALCSAAHATSLPAQTERTSHSLTPSSFRTRTTPPPHPLAPPDSPRLEESSMAWISRLPHRTRWPGPPGPHRSTPALTALTRSRLPHRTRWPGPPGPHRSPRALTALTCSAPHGSHPHSHQYPAQGRLRPTSPTGRPRALFHSPARGLTRRMRHRPASRPPPSAHAAQTDPAQSSPLVTQT